MKMKRAALIDQIQQARETLEKPEIELQKLVANWLNLHSIYFEWDRTDKRTSGKRGRADFRICVPPGGVWLSAECKAAGESLSPEQATEAARLRNSGGRFVVCFCLGDLIEAIRRIGPGRP